MGRREKSPLEKGPRIFIDGACVDNIELIKLVEETGGNVVADTICNGTRDHFPLTDVGGDPDRMPSPIGIWVKSTAPRPTGKTRRAPFREILNPDSVTSEPMPRNSRWMAPFFMSTNIAIPLALRSLQERPTISRSMSLFFIWRMSILRARWVNSKPGSRPFWR